MMNGFAWCKVVKGDIYKYLKNIKLIGRINHEKEFIVYGCKEKDETAFYEALLENDKENNIIGFNDIAEVEEYWMNEADMFLIIKNGDYEVIEHKDISKL